MKILKKNGLRGSASEQTYISQHSVLRNLMLSNPTQDRFLVIHKISPVSTIFLLSLCSSKERKTANQILFCAKELP